MFRKAMLLSVVALLATAPSALAAQVPNPPLSFKITASERIGSGGTLHIYLQVRSKTDMPVPGVSVVLSHCQTGQQKPFQLTHRTRHLAVGYEKLWLNADGNIVWSLQSAPANTEQPKVLDLPFQLSQGKGGSTWCIHGSGATTVSATPVSPPDVWVG